MQKFIVLATIAILARSPIALAGTVVTNNAQNSNTIIQNNTNIGSSGIQQGGAQLGTSILNQNGVVNTNGAASVTNIGTNLNSLTQNNTTIGSTPGVTVPSVQGGSQIGVAIVNQLGIAISSGFNPSASVMNNGLAGNYLGLTNIAIDSNGKYTTILGGGLQSGLSIVTQSAMATVNPPLAQDLNGGCNNWLCSSPMMFR
jgi:hypothetical protein